MCACSVATSTASLFPVPCPPSPTARPLHPLHPLHPRRLFPPAPPCALLSPPPFSPWSTAQPSPPLDGPPTRAELVAAAGRVRNGTSVGFHGVPAEVMKRLLANDTTAGVVVEVMRRYWCSSDADPAAQSAQVGAPRPRPRPCSGRRECRVHYTEFDVAKVAALPKKGDATDAASWRTIAVLDAFGLLVSAVVAARTRAWLAPRLPESANGFRKGRGVVDCLWNVMEALRMRRRQRVVTWAVFCDIKAAFDRVGRCQLFRCLEVLGFPPRFVAVLRDLHRGATFKFKVGNRWYSVRNRAGVRAGDSAGPDLFLVLMLAIFEYVEWPDGAAPVFVSSRHWQREDGDDIEFEMPSSEYADDCGLLFASRQAAESGLVAFNHAVEAISGMLMHYATDAASVELCKTVAIAFPPPGVRLEDLDTSPLRFAVGGGNFGYVGFVEQTKYLGMLIHYDLGSERALSARVAASAGAMGAMTEVLLHERLAAKAKGIILTSSVQSIVLYTPKSSSRSPSLVPPPATPARLPACLAVAY